MRDPERIDNFMMRLGELWKTYCPDLRFGQLMSNIASYSSRDIFFLEEEEFYKTVLQYMQDYFPKSGAHPM